MFLCCFVVSCIPITLFTMGRSKQEGDEFKQSFQARYITPFTLGNINQVDIEFVRYKQGSTTH